MKKNLLLILIIISSLGVFGCGAALQEQVDANLVSVELLKGRSADINEELTELGDKVNNLYTQIADLSTQLEDLSKVQEETTALKTEVANIDTRLEQIGTRKPGDLRVKVLSGDGKMKSAKALEKRLKSYGYVIERVDFAPYKTFSRHTVFYAGGYKEDAEEMVRQLGGRTISKPMTWPSIFDIIAVSGRTK